MDVSSSSLNRSMIGEAFENDDYDYLINCTDLITTCQEALQENVPDIDAEDHHNTGLAGTTVGHSPQQTHLLPTDQTHHLHHASSLFETPLLDPSLHPSLHHHAPLLNHLHVHSLEASKGGFLYALEHESSSLLRAPSSAASSGLGLSLEEDGSLKYCHSDEEFSSLNSTVGLSGLSINSSNSQSQSHSSTNSTESLNASLKQARDGRKDEQNSKEEAEALSSDATANYSGTALVAEFIEWLDYAESRLESLCYCAKIQSSTCDATLSLSLTGKPTELKTAKPNAELMRIAPTTVSDTVHYVNELECNGNGVAHTESHFSYEEASVEEKHARHDDDDGSDVGGNVDDEHQDEQVNNLCGESSDQAIDKVLITQNHQDHGLLDETEAEAWMMSLSPVSQSVESTFSELLQTKNKITRAFRDGNNEYSAVLSDCSEHAVRVPNSVTLAAQQSNQCDVDWDAVQASYKSFHNEFERICHRFLKEIAEHRQQNLDQNRQEHSLNRTLRHERERCLSLWIKSLEYLIILQESNGQRCPKHYFAARKNRRRAGVLSTSTPDPSDATTTKSFQEQFVAPSPPVQAPIALSPLNEPENRNTKRNKRRNYTLLFSSSGGSFSPYRSLVGSDNSRSLGFHSLGVFCPTSSVKKSQQPQLPLRQEARVSSPSVWSVFSRRLSTAQQHYHEERCTQSETEATMIEPDFHHHRTHYRHYPSDTHSLDGSGSPSADSGVFSSSTTSTNVTGSNMYEIAQKDIGYSSDADMSDEVNGQANGQASASRSSRKQKVKRRRTRTARPRPWSYHADWTDWDYYQTPFLSTEDILNEHEQENALRRLTEFGENYEHWFASSELDNDFHHENSKLSQLMDGIHLHSEQQHEGHQIEGEHECKQNHPNQEVEEEELQISTAEQELNCYSSEDRFEHSAEQKQNENFIVEKKDASCSPIPFLMEGYTSSIKKTSSVSTETEVEEACSKCCKHGKKQSTKPYSSIKFYTSVALSGLFAIFFAVSQFSPEIEKTYSRPPPI